MRGERVGFSAALSNWRRSIGMRDTGVGWKDTCGSAERMYAQSPERDRSRGDEPLIGVDSSLAERFQSFIRQLPEDERVAWLTKHGVLRRQEQVQDAWVDSYSEKARVRLIMWWAGVPI